MTLIFKIAKNELRQLFFSSTAWFVAFVFMLVCAFFYIGIMYPVAKTFFEVRSVFSPLQTAMAELDSSRSSITDILFTDSYRGFFNTFLPYVYLFFPLLTMGVINREFNTGTSQLLRSSPLTLRQIILGKYLAYTLFNLLLLMIIGLFIICGALHIKSIDLPRLLCGLGGFFLLFSTYTAIGFFASSLTRYQIVAGIGTFIILGVLANISSVWQQYAFMREISWLLSLQNRIQHLIRGLIRSKDIVYYLIIIVLFLSYTWLRMRGEQKRQAWYTRAFQYVGLLGLAAIVGFIASLPRFVVYFDTAGNRGLTVDPQLQNAISELNQGPLQVTVYANLFDSDGFALVAPSKRNQLRDEFETITRFKADIHVKYVYYYHYRSAADSVTLQRTYPGKNVKQIAELLSPMFYLRESDLLSPAEIDQLVDAKAESYELFVHAAYNGVVTPFRTVPKSPLDWNVRSDDGSQPHFYAAFKRLAGAKMPKVLFVTGNLERSLYKRGERGFTLFANDKKNYLSLTNIGFDVDTVNLRTQNINSDIDVLVLADPKVVLDSGASRKITDYLKTGGNMLIMGEPGKQYVLNPLLNPVGMKLRDGQLVEPQRHLTPDNISVNLTLNDTILSAEPAYHQRRELFNHGYPVNYEVGRVQGATAVGPVGNNHLFTWRPLFTTIDGRAWIQSQKLVTDSTLPAFNPAAGDVKENNFPFIAGFTRTVNNKEQRIVLSGDADLASNGSVLYGGYPRSLISWLAYNKSPMYIESVTTRDNNLFMRSIAWNNTEKIICLYVLPAILLISGAIVITRRKRK